MKTLRMLSGLLLSLGLFSTSLPSLVAAEKSVNSTQSVRFVGPIAAGEVRPHVYKLAGAEMEGRGTARGKRLAREYLIRQYQELGLKPLFPDGGFLQQIPGKTADDGRPTVRGINVGAWLPGSDAELRDEFIIVSAHYDHLGILGGRIYPGADDNASSMAMVLEVARQLKKQPNPPRRSIVFLNFDLEENLLWGSRWFAAHPPWPIEQVKLFITADLLGRSLGNLPMQSVFVLGSERAPELRTVLQRVGSPRGLQVERLCTDLVGTRSDYGPFRDRRIPFLFFSTGEHPDYHTPQDTADRIDYEQLARISNLVLKIVADVADADSPPEWATPPKSDFAEVEALHRITAQIMAAHDGGVLNLGKVQRFFVSNIHTKLGSIIERGDLQPHERPWLIRSAQFLLITVF